jgi:hypothetical protein
MGTRMILFASNSTLKMNEREHLTAQAEKRKVMRKKKSRISAAFIISW